MNMRDILLASRLGGGSGGGAASWADLTDKPFGEVTEEYNETAEMTIEWDGVIGDRLTVDASSALGMDGAVIVHVSDAIVPNKEALVGATMTSMYNGQSVSNTLTEDLLYGLVVQDGVFLLGETGFSVSEDNTVVSTFGMTFPKKGLYFLYAGETVYGFKYTGVLHAAGTRTVIQKIDEKYLPEPLAYETGKDPIAYDGNFEGKDICDFAQVMGSPFELPNRFYFVHVSDEPFASLAEAQNSKVTGYIQDGKDVERENRAYTLAHCARERGNGFIDCGNDNLCVISVPSDNFTAPAPSIWAGATFPKRGLYFVDCYVDMEGMFMDIRMESIAFPQDIKKLDPKFLPDTIAPKELVLTSSTEGSTKRFKITVDDSGTIKAEAVS